MRWIHELYIDIRVGLSCDPHIDILLRDLLLMLLLVFVTSGCHNKLAHIMPYPKEKASGLNSKKAIK